MKHQTKRQTFTLSALLGFGLANVLSAMPTIIQPPNTIDTDTVWDSDTNDDGEIDQIYYLDEAIFVGDFNGGGTRPTLTITPGTVIAATGSSSGTDGLDVGSLVIAQSGAINAEGTADAPIIFTSAAEAEFLYNVDVDGGGINTTKPDPLGGDADGSDGGQWGGVIILGNAPINFYNTPTNNLNSNAVEGFAQNAAGDDILYGGDDPSDNSGILRYVSIRFGGFEFAQDEEINGLTMGGVGSGTTIDHVEVVANTDDGFEWFGGTVNTSHLFALYCQDESFDIDEGHQGTHQFWFAVQSNSSDYGTEADGGNRTGAGIKTGEPLSLTKIFNATYVGATGDVDESEEGAEIGSSDSFRMKDNFAGQFHNGIFTSSGDDIFRIDDASTIAQVGVNLNFTNNLFGTPDDAETSNSGNANADAEAALLAQTGNEKDVDVQFSAVTRNAVGEVTQIDPRPQLGSPAWTNELTAGAPCPTNYRGAFGLDNWASGWTYADANGLFADAGPAPQAITIVQPPNTIDTDTTWDSDSDDDGRIDTIYYLDEAIFVGDFSGGGSRPTLTIAPGTIIAATGSSSGTDGLDVGSLVVAQTGAINAEGTPNAPIIFTSAAEAEYLYNVEIDGGGINTTKPDPIGGDADGSDGGAWGGVIILGNAPINYYNTPTNNLNSNAVEGFAQNAAGDDILYGGDVADDNSGILRYVSIRFGGFEFAQDEEINGLTMAGVGSGTTIDHVEVVANTDDGFEWFGGTVNTSHLFALYCQDESFDIDEGHQGTHQFWFAVQSNNSDYGTEADGGNRTGAGVKTGDPLSNTKIYNATYVGATGEVDESGEGAIIGSSDSFRMKDNFAGQFHNGIFTSSGDDIVRIDDASTIAQVGVNLNLTYNLFGTPDDAETSNSGNASADAEAALLAQDGNIKDATIDFSLEMRNDVGEVVKIDPRPTVATSQAWGGDLLAGAPVQVPYRGAFGTDLWVSTWTYASKEGIVSPGLLTVETPVPTFVELSTKEAITIVQPPNTIDVDTVWNSDSDGNGKVDQIFFLNEAIFVGDFSGGGTRPTLTIAPGTIIAATGSSAGTDGLDVGSLVIAQTGAINAEGTAENPIVFTSIQEAEFLCNVDIDGVDGINTIKPDPIGGDADGSDGGQWGGVIILGNAPINFYNTPTNNLNSNAVEGFAQNAAGDDILYGGDVADDNSGILRYVSIRFGGFEFAQDEEINGLTMAGVGSGTTIDHVEVVANTDDGFEWFGGTVNTSHLFALYCQDESFDIDEGHQGTHQFWFAIQSNSSDYGTEADGGNRTGAGVKTGEPLSNTMIYNATYIGATGDVDESGEGAVIGSSDSFRMKDNFAGQFHNGIFTSSGDDIFRIDDASTIAQVGVNLNFTNNLFGTPDDAETSNSGNANADAEAALLAQAGNQKDVDVQFSSVTRNVVGEVTQIDPRPKLSSPAWTNELTEGAPSPTTYRGAFGVDNWAAGWTYADANGIFTDEFVIGDPLQVVSTEFDGTSYTINFVAEAGASYKVTQSATMEGAFADVAGATLDDAPTIASISFEPAPGASKLFFRVEKVAE